MQKYIVSLDFITPCTVPSCALFDLLGLKRNVLISRKIDNDFLWMLESDIDEELPIINHIENIIKKINNTVLIKSHNFIKQAYVSIGVLYDENPPRVNLNSDWLKIVETKISGIGIQFDFYPTSFSENEQVERR